MDGQNDFGEDRHVTFTEDGEVTGDLVKIQVKGGRSWRRADGYAVPIGDHGSTWADGNLPVLCVVHDPDTDGLYWANATKQLLSARRNGEVLNAIAISPDQELDDESIANFVAEVRRCLTRYRGNRIIQARLGEKAGVEFGPWDIVRHRTGRSSGLSSSGRATGSTGWVGTGTNAAGLFRQSGIPRTLPEPSACFSIG